MQLKRQTNQERSENTRTALIGAARALIVQQGYAVTSTTQIVAKAGVTRGALYHHFDDKRALFHAVVEEEAREVARKIAQKNAKTAQSALVAGAKAYFEAMSIPARARILLIEGPAVLGQETMDKIDAATGRTQLRDGLQFAKERGELHGVNVDALATLLSAAFDRAALAIASGESPTVYQSAIRLLLKGVVDGS